ANTTSGNELYIQDLRRPEAPIVNVVDNFEKDHSVIGNDGETLFIHTNQDAPNYRLIQVSAADPSPANWKDLIPETEQVLTVATGGGQLFAHYLKDATSLVKQFDFKGKPVRTVAL